MVGFNAATKLPFKTVKQRSTAVLRKNALAVIFGTSVQRSLLVERRSARECSDDVGKVLLQQIFPINLPPLIIKARIWKLADRGTGGLTAKCKSA